MAFSSIPHRENRFQIEFVSLKTVFETQSYEEGLVHFDRLSFETQTVVLNQLNDMFPPQVNFQPHIPRPLDLERFSCAQIKKFLKILLLEEWPKDILIKILAELPSDALLNMEQVCKYFRTLFATNQLWIAIGQKEQFPMKKKMDYFNFILHMRLVWMLKHRRYTFDTFDQLLGKISICSEFRIKRQREVWDLIENRRLIKLSKQTPKISCLKEVNGYLFTGSEEGTIKIWNMLSQKCVETLKNKTTRITYLEKNQDNNVLCSGSEKGEITWWKGSPATLQFYSTEAHQGEVTALILEENTLYSASLDRTIKVWNSQELIHIFEGHIQGIRCLVKNQNSLFSASDDHTIRKWDLKTKSCIHTFEHTDRVIHLQLDPHFLFSSTSCETKVWDLISNQCVLELRNHVKITFLKKQGSLFYVGDKDKVTAYTFKSFPYNELFKIARLFHQDRRKEGVEHFCSFTDTCRIGVYEQFYRINNFKKRHHELVCAKNSFLDNGQSDCMFSDQARAKAIYCFVLKDILFYLKSDLRRMAMTLFKRLPKKTQNKIHKEFRTPTSSSISSHQLRNKTLWIQAIQNYLQKLYKCNLPQRNV